MEIQLPFPPDTETLQSFGDTSKVLALLAQGLRLGEGNLPALTAEEKTCLGAAMFGTMVDIMAIRMLPEFLEDFQHPGCESLRQKLAGMRDLELIALVLRHTDIRQLFVAHGSI